MVHASTTSEAAFGAASRPTGGDDDDEVGAYQCGYEQGHYDAAHDIHTNASAQVQLLSHAYHAQRATEIATACAAVKVKYERLMKTLVADKDAEVEYLEMRRASLGNKATSKPWKITVHRAIATDCIAEDSGHLMHGLSEEENQKDGEATAEGVAGGIDYADVIRAFRAVYEDPKRKRAHLYCNTVVTFVDPFGRREDGHDLGGLTTEMLSRFFIAVLDPTAGIFEHSSSRTGAAAALPRADAPKEVLEAIGLVLVKCIVDDHPIAHGLSSFVLDYLVNESEASALVEPFAALRALRGFDRELADSWGMLLEQPALVEQAGLTLDAFDGVAEHATTPVNAANIHRAILQGCTQRLLGHREPAFRALKRGFVCCEDLQVQLAALGHAEDLSLLLQGKQSLSTAELLDCFNLMEAEDEEGFAAIGSSVLVNFVQLLQDETVFGESRRLSLLRWCTALHALPIGGLREDRIKLKLFGEEVDDMTLPETHTCTRELHIPNYSSASVLKEKLLLALEHEKDGFGKE